MKLALALAFASLIVVPSLRGADYPTHTLKSEHLQLKIYLPDSENGFYRGTRFDGSGVFTVEFGGHKLFGPWKDKHDPKNNDDIVGPCEEFGSGFSSPLNYKEAEVGGRFLKIGVGELEKPKEEKYRFFNNYKIAKAGEWKIEKSEGKITFAQSIKTDFGYAYTYTKILLLDGKELRILHVLENTCDKPISTDCYNHNFFNVDGDGVGKNYRLDLPFEPKDTKVDKGSNPAAKWVGKSLTFTDPLDKGQIYFELGGFDPKPGSKDAGVTMKHLPSGVSVRATGDRPPSRFNVWGIGSTLCPEPFVQLDIEPGKKAVWSWKYEFAK